MESRDTKWYRDRIDYLTEFISDERTEVLNRVLDQRTKYMTVCLENMFHPQNASALVRHCDAFGLQEVHTIEEHCKFKPTVRIVRGTDKWIDIKRHESTKMAIDQLRRAGYRIVATTPHQGDTTPEKFDVSAAPFALVFGTEHAGVSDEIIESADEFLRIPMQGFVESLNVSASAAILIYMLSQRVRNSMEQEVWALSEEQKAPLLFDWIMKSIKDAKGVLSRFPR